MECHNSAADYFHVYGGGQLRRQHHPARLPGCQRQRASSRTRLPAIAGAVRHFVRLPEPGTHQRGNVGNVSYNSLQARINKRFASGYQFTGAFTYQKTIADNYIDPFNRSLYKGPTSTPNWWLVVSHVWEVPFGPGHRLGARRQGLHAGSHCRMGIYRSHAIAGWKFPHAVDECQHAEHEFLSASESDRLRHVANARANLWFNPAAFAIPAAYTYGNTGTGILHGPGQFIADWGLNKSFSFKSLLNENTRLVFRWEAFNALNHRISPIPRSPSMLRPVRRVISSMCKGRCEGCNSVSTCISDMSIGQSLRVFGYLLWLACGPVAPPSCAGVRRPHPKCRAGVLRVQRFGPCCRNAAIAVTPKPKWAACKWTRPKT